MSESPWHIYLLRTRRGTLYTGITLDVARRLDEHHGRQGRGAKYLRAMTPLRLEYSAVVGEKGLALQLEKRIKSLKKTEKEQIVQEQPTVSTLLIRFALDPG